MHTLMNFHTAQTTFWNANFIYWRIWTVASLFINHIDPWYIWFRIWATRNNYYRPHGEWSMIRCAPIAV